MKITRSMKVILRNSELKDILNERFGNKTHSIIELSDSKSYTEREDIKRITIEITANGDIYFYDGWLDEIKVKV